MVEVALRGYLPQLFCFVITFALRHVSEMNLHSAASLLFGQRRALRRLKAELVLGNS